NSLQLFLYRREGMKVLLQPCEFGCVLLTQLNNLLDRHLRDLFGDNQLERDHRQVGFDLVLGERWTVEHRDIKEGLSETLHRPSDDGEVVERLVGQGMQLSR